jgi:phosphatidylglycerol:prolipoprotein diacylglycerol transferase
MYPVLFKIGSFEVESYFTLISIALIVCILYALKRAKPLTEKNTDFFDLAMITIIGVYLGGRIFHIVFENPKFYLENPIEILKVWKGGFVVYGSLFFGGLFASLFIKFKKMPALQTADIIAPTIVVAMGIGRLACFLTGCCYGKTTDSIFGIVFPFSRGLALHPTQLYQSLSGFLVWGIVILFETKLKRFYKEGLSFSLVLILYPLSRFIIENFRNDFRGVQILTLSISQFFSLLFVLLGVTILIKIYRKKS